MDVLLDLSDILDLIDSVDVDFLLKLSELLDLVDSVNVDFLLNLSELFDLVDMDIWSTGMMYPSRSTTFRTKATFN